MNRTKLFILLTLCALSGLLMLVTPSARAWQTTISDCPGCGSRAEASVVDASGDIITTGSFFYGSDVIKLSGATGQVIWRSEVMGHESRNYVQDIAIDSHGDVFVVFAWTRLVIKVSGSTGAKIWEKPIEGTLNACQSFISAVEVDRDDNVVTAGTIGCLLNVAKLDGQTGDEKWHYEREGLAKAVAVDPFGDVAAAGLMNRNFAVVKVSGEDGHELWQREINGAGNFSDVFEEANDVAMDKDGSVVVAGATSNEEANSRDFTVAKYTSTGVRQWLHAIDGRWCETNDLGQKVCQSNDEAQAVTIDKDGNVIAAGTLQVDGNPFIRGAVEHFHVIKFSKEGAILWSEAAQDPPRNEEYTPGHAFAISVDSAGDVAAGGVHDGRFTVVKFLGAMGARAWPPHQVNSGGLGNGNNAVAILMDADKNVVAAGEIIGPDGWSKFTVIKLRGTDGADYFADPTPTPTVPETVLKYAPLVYLHPEEAYLPGNPITFIQNSKLGWSHQSTVLSVVPCPGDDHEVAARGTVDASKLGVASSSPYAHSPLNHTNLLCHDYGEDMALKASDYTRPFDGSKRDNILGELEGYMKEGFYLDPADEPDLRRGIGNGAPVFYEYVKGKYVTYWFFYPYDLFRIEIPGVLSVPSQFHEGDWEGISIQLDENDSPVNVLYNAHDGGKVVPWGLVNIYDNTHPIVFSAKGSHGSYPIKGEFPTAACIPGTSRCALDRIDYGPKWTTWINLLQVESQPWYGFGGAWGEVGENPIEVFGLSGKDYTGPLGPSKYKNSRGEWFLSISGRVTQVSGIGFRNVDVALTDIQGNKIATKSTDENGYYSFLNLTFDKGYAVYPSKEGYSFSPAIESFFNLRKNQTVDFIAEDIIPPVLKLPPAITVDAYIPQGATVYYTVTATDNVTQNPRIACAPLPGSLFAIGTTTVACTATDDAGNSSNGTFKVIVKGASEQITDLVTLVKGFNFQNGIENGLLVKLENALSAAKAGDKVGACNQLTAFINQVQAQSGKKISVAQANQMLTAANRIRAVNGCR